MLDRFNEIYNIPKGTPFKRVELEDVLIEKYENLTYNKFGGWKSSDGSIYPAMYHVGTKEKWGLYEICTDSENYGSHNSEEALLALFIKYGVEPDE